MKKIFLILLIFQSILSTVQAQLIVKKLRVENSENPIGIDIKEPYFSWQLSSNQRNVLQTAYEIRVATDSAQLKKENFSWTTGKIISDQSIHIPYKGEILVSDKKYFWQVRIWDNQGNLSAWSNIAFWQMALLKTTDWKAKWIMPNATDSAIHSPLFRKKISVNKKVKTATAYITAHGLYEAQINGKRLGDAYFTPGFTSYNKRLQYQAYDVTTLLNKGNSAIGVMLGDGWYRGTFSFKNKNIYGKDIALLLQLNIVYEDGTTENIVSDETWKYSTGEVYSSEIYAGETIDTRLKKKGWALPIYNDSNWSAVTVANFTKDNLIATYNEPVKKHETFKPISVFKTPKGEQVIDFGQNLVGWVTINAKGKLGDKLVISHAEVLDKNGNFYTDNLRTAKAQDTYILNGLEEEILEPHFTWHGFRYIKIEGYDGEIKPENFTAVALYSAMKSTASFTTSNKLINQLQSNIEWGLKGNFLDIPTDCPQRDERLGWAGDAQVFFRTSSYLRDVNNFFTKWMKDLIADQRTDGSIPHVIPNTIGDKGWAEGSSAGWGDVATIIPWTLYEVYGDKRILENQYPSMKKWVNYVTSKSKKNLWNTGKHFGDWLSYSLAVDDDGKSAITNKYFIAQCFYAYSTQLLINAAKVLDKKEDEEKYYALLKDIKDAFVKEYITANGVTVSNTQTSYVLALQFDMLPIDLRQQAADRLVANIEQYGNHLTTGFLGTPYLCHVLTRFGYSHIAYKLLLQETYPSWLYPVTKGATTIWERWDGIKPNGNFQTVDMNSFNHYAYGAIGDWMYRTIIGLDNEKENIGYKKINIQPQIGGSFSYARATYESYYGKIAVGWKIENSKINLSVEVPANTTATVYIPYNGSSEIKENKQIVSSTKAIQIVQVDKEYVILKVGSGNYDFEAEYKAK